jgi:SulP family sulfate permease
MLNLSPELVKAFRAVQFLTDDIILAANLDGSLEWCENAIIEANRADDDQTETLSGWLTFALGNVDYADILASFCTRVAVGTGDVIACQGTPSDSMHFILEGRVGINIDMGAGRVVRVRSLGRHTTVGEMGLLTGQTRSATITAESESVLYELRADAFEKIKAENPKLIQALLTYIIRVMTERLSFASRLIGVLKR